MHVRTRASSCVWHVHCMYAHRYVQERASEAIDASLAELDATLPRGLKGIRLQELSLGPNPPVVRSVAAVRTPGPPPHARDGCALQAEVEWDAPLASATLLFRMTNVASQPRLRLRRARLRGTVRLHWEWIEAYPWVGRVRTTFVRRPEVGLLFPSLAFSSLPSPPSPPFPHLLLPSLRWATSPSSPSARST